MLKIGRTQLQDAVPMTLGQEFSSAAVMLGGNEQRPREAALKVTGINPCATAVDTGVIAHPEIRAADMFSPCCYYRDCLDHRIRSPEP